LSNEAMQQNPFVDLGLYRVSFEVDASRHTTTSSSPSCLEYNIHISDELMTRFSLSAKSALSQSRTLTATTVSDRSLSFNFKIMVTPKDTGAGDGDVS
jgi:hypothetical protein